MTDEFKSIEHSPDRRDISKRGRPFFSIRRRVDPEADQKWHDERRKYYEEVGAFQAKVLLVYVLVLVAAFIGAAQFK